MYYINVNIINYSDTMGRERVSYLVSSPSYLKSITGLKRMMPSKWPMKKAFILGLMTSKLLYVTLDQQLR